MRSRVTFLMIVAVAWFTSEQLHAGEAKPFTYRWVFAFGKELEDDAGLKYIEDLVDTSAAHGLNGMMLGASLDRILDFDAPTLERLKKLKTYCDEKKIEIIPLLLSAGYGSGVVRRDPNLSEGLLARDVLFAVKGTEANVVSDSPISAADGGFENHNGDKVKGFDYQDEPGKCTFIDSNVAKEGKVSLRMENFKENKGRVRLIKDLPALNRHYVVRFWAKAEGIGKATLSACVYDGEEQVTRLNFELKDGADWKKFDFSVNTLDDDKTKLYLGAWEAKAGKIWIDGVEVFEPGLVNVLRRPGTPIVVKKDGSGEVFQEGADFEKIEDKNIHPSQAWHEPPPIRLTKGSKIKDGDKLRVSYYTSLASTLDKRQTVVCMSEPKTFDVWKEIVSKVNDILHPKTWMLDMDEIRGGGTCEACRARKAADGSRMTAAQILGDCVTRQVALIKSIAPNSEVAVWNDMLDPDANAKSHYYTVPGGYAGSWNYIPKDMIVVPWILEIGEKSIAHFSKLGERIVAGAYYDADDLDGCKKWMEMLSKSPNSVGIMYTSWEVKYKLLADFGDLVSKK